MPENENSFLKILPLGGLGEIGMNMMAVSWGKDALIIDAGLMFPDQSMPGVDLVIPDVELLMRQGWNVLGIILTHGHEDHIGALPYVLPRISTPIYATSFTMGLVEHKLDEFGLLGTTERHEVSPGDSIRFGPFEVDFISMCHSIADSVGLAVRTPAGLLLHSGDFKMDPSPIDGKLCDLAKIAAYGKEGVLALLSDSTNVENEGRTGSESAVRPVLEGLFREATGRILVATFSSNTHRLQQVLDISHAYGRKVVLVGRSMEVTTRIAQERRCLHLPSDIFIDVKDINGLPDERVTILSTGSQGEPLSTLALMAADRHKYLQVKKGDLLVLSSRFIPGNEKAITQIINQFFQRGARVEYEKILPVHVSGHAGREELRTVLRLARPRYFIPVHGEYRHLVHHGRLAAEEGVSEDRIVIAQDGDLIELSQGGFRITHQEEMKRVFVDGKGVGDIGNEVLRDRRLLAEVGLVTVVVVIRGDTGEILSGPQIYTRGVTYQDLEDELLHGTTAAVQQKLAELPLRPGEEWAEYQEEIRLAVRRHIKRVLGRKPLVQTIVVKT
ncbi:MAG: ribonuclease J [Thermodesulfobacteriota bacterium]